VGLHPQRRRPDPAGQQAGRHRRCWNQHGAEQGWSVALAADGNTAITGGRSDNNGNGAAWVFVQPTQDDCKDGGWRNFISSPGPFTNQGQCLSYFAKQ
jgi:hypothetical protein